MGIVFLLGQVTASVHKCGRKKLTSAFRIYIHPVLIKVLCAGISPANAEHGSENKEIP